MPTPRPVLDSQPQIARGEETAPHVVYVCNPPWMGGAEEFLVRLITTVKQVGWRTTLILPDRPHLQSVVERLQGIGAQVLATQVKTERDYLIPALLHLADVPQRTWLKRALQELAPDIVHVNQPIAESAQLALQAAASLHLPVVTTVHQYKSVLVRGHKLARLRDAVIDWHYRNVQAISLPVARAARVLEQQYPRTRGKTWIVPPAIDVDLFNPERVAPRTPIVRARLDPAGDQLLVGVVARLAKEKGQRALLTVWPRIRQRIPHAQLILAGDGPDRQMLEELCRNLRIKDSVTLLGHVPPQGIPELLSALDVVVQPSFHECLPLAMLEAMVMRRAVIATAVDAIPDVLTHESAGIIVPPADADALADAVVRLLDDRELADRLGRQAQRIVLERFTPGEQLRQVFAFYERILSCPHSAVERGTIHVEAVSRRLY